MEIPDLVTQRLGDEEIHAGVSLGDEDVLCLTPTRALVYSGEGLLSDESVEVFPHDVERLSVSDGRRKTKFELAYVDGTRSFTVPRKRSEAVLEMLLEGILHVADVSESGESVAGIFRFSELTLVVTDRRLVKHVGAATWDEDYEEFPFEAVTGLEFEEGSVATAIVISVDGRPKRIKAPNDRAPQVRRTLETALFDYHGVESVQELNDALAPDESGEDATGTAAGSPGGFGLEDDIDPLVGGASDDEGARPIQSEGDGRAADDPTEAESRRPISMEVDPTVSDESDGTPVESGPTAADAGSEPPAAESLEPAGDEDSDPGSGKDGGGFDFGADDAPGADAEPSTPPEHDVEPASHEDLESLAAEVEELQAAVAEQNDLLRKQHRAIKHLLSELDGR